MLRTTGDRVDPSKNTSPPFSMLWPILAGALAGVALRFVFFGEPGHAFAAMTGAFIYLSPLVVGAVTVYVAERTERRSWSYYAGASFVATCCYVFGTMLVMIEGMICAVLIIPLFAVLGSLGGLVMGAVCRLTNWPKQTLYSFAVLPLLVGVLEPAAPFPDRYGAIERKVVVNAPAEMIWRQIMNAPDIKADELEDAWLFRIGVPLVHSGTLKDTSEGQVRRVTMAKNVYFDEVITDAQQPRFVHWTYRYYDDSFPPYALDDHVRLGGEYFDITDTSYTLTKDGDRTILGVQMRYRLSTRFNWYADPLAQWILGNLAEINLRFYRHRSEAGLEARS